LGRGLMYVMEREQIEYGERDRVADGSEPPEAVPVLEQYWAHASAHVRFVLALPATPATTAIRSLATRYLEEVAALVPETHRVTLPDSDLPPMVQRAMAFIEANLHRRLSAAELAEAAGSSLRALQGAFTISVGTSPMRYVVDARIAAAHTQLLADPSVSIGTLARQWGFTNGGRFSARYREIYGENPAQTRRRLDGAGVTTQANN